MNEFDLKGKSSWDPWTGFDERKFLKDSSLFSTSLPVFRHEKPNVNNHVPDYSLTGDISSSFINYPDIKHFEANVHHANEAMLPDNDDEFIAGIINGLDFDSDEYDLFGSGGGLEIESDAKESVKFGLSRLTLSDSANGNGMAQFLDQNSVGSMISGEHPLGEHPSRTLFVRNINSSVEDKELTELFQRFGDIRSLYTTCKHRGFVMISYYDIRAARAAMRELQDKSLRKRKLDIHFSIPKDNPSEKELNQGTLVVFGLDPSITNEDILNIFGAHGEIKEIRETPHKRHHKFVEFYDVRHAAAAQSSLNRMEIAGSGSRGIKVEFSRPGGTRQNLAVHTGQDLIEADEPPSFLHQMASSFGNSSPGNWPKLGSPLEQSPLSSLSKSTDFRSLSPILHNVSGLDSVFQRRASNSTIVASDLDNMLNNGKNASYKSDFQQPVSFPESYSSHFSGSASSFGVSNSNGSGIGASWGPQFNCPRLYSESLSNSSSLRGQSFGHHSLASNEPAHEFLFSGSPQAQRPHHHDVGSAPSGVRFEKHTGFYQGGAGFWPKDMNFAMNPGARTYVSSSVSNSDSYSNSSSFRCQSSGDPLASNDPANAFSFFGSPQAQRLHHHDVGSAPSCVRFEKHTGFDQGGADFRPKDRNFAMIPGACTNVSSSVSNSESYTNSLSLRCQSFGDHPLASNDPANAFSFFGSPQTQCPHHHDVGSAPSCVRFEKHTGFYRGGADFRPRDRKFAKNPGARTNVSSSVSNSDNSAFYRMMASSSERFDLDLNKIKNGEDTRTTLMLKNIPNKYTCNMLLDDIDEYFKGTYDFFYLPIDFKNQCSVGYAFINLLSPSHIIPFYEAFNGRKWDKFNSGKVACLAFARIQGKAALISHFENSSLMNVEMHCRPIFFLTDGSDSHLQENPNFQVRQVNGLDRKEPSGSLKGEGRFDDQVDVKG